MSSYRRLVYAAVIGIALGLSIGWFADGLPRPLGLVLIFGLLAAVMWWALRQLAWARRMGRELRQLRKDSDEDC
jgi:hypothetical protein